MSRIPQTGDIITTRKTMNNKFFIYVPQCENINIFVYLSIKSKIWRNKIRGPVGPLHKIQGYRGHQNVSKCRPHHSGDICITRGNNWKPVFHILAKMWQMYIFWLFEGSWAIRSGYFKLSRSQRSACGRGGCGGVTTTKPWYPPSKFVRGTIITYVVTYCYKMW